MYYILAEQLTGELIQVSSEPLTQGEGQIVKLRQGDLPDLSKYEYHPSSLAFIERSNNRFLTQEEFARRLTDSELRAIYTLAKNNIDVEIWLDRFKMAKEIDLDDSFLVNGLYGLAQVGIFTDERIIELLG
jgi:hypothetical protein